MLKEHATYPPELTAPGGGDSTPPDPLVDSRWEMLVDPIQLEEEVGDCVLRISGTRRGLTSLTLDTCQPGAKSSAF